LLPLFQFAPPYVRLVIAYESVMVNETVLVVTAVHIMVVLFVATNVGAIYILPPIARRMFVFISSASRTPFTIKSPGIVTSFMVATVANN